MAEDTQSSTARVATTIGMVAATATAALGAILAFVYRPSADWSDTFPGVADESGTSMLSALHTVTTVTMIAAAATAAIAVILVLARSEPEWAMSQIPRAGTAGAALIAALATQVTTGMVAWDQVALESVTVGTRAAGYWFVAFDEGVRFLLVGGAEVSQGAYRVALAVHLLAPCAAGLALWATRRWMDAPGLDVPAHDAERQPA